MRYCCPKTNIFSKKVKKHLAMWEKCTYFAVPKRWERWSDRLMVRTSDFHSGNRGSIPRRTAKRGDKASLFCPQFF